MARSSVFRAFANDGKSRSLIEATPRIPQRSFFVIATQASVRMLATEAMYAAIVDATEFG